MEEHIVPVVRWADEDPTGYLRTLYGGMNVVRHKHPAALRAIQQMVARLWARIRDAERQQLSLVLTGLGNQICLASLGAVEACQIPGSSVEAIEVRDLGLSAGRCESLLPKRLPSGEVLDAACLVLINMSEWDEITTGRDAYYAHKVAHECGHAVYFYRSCTAEAYRQALQQDDKEREEALRSHYREHTEVFAEWFADKYGFSEPSIVHYRHNYAKAAQFLIEKDGLSQSSMESIRAAYRPGEKTTYSNQ